MNDRARHTPSTRKERIAVGTAYVVLPLAAAVGLIAPVLSLTTAPVGTRPTAQGGLFAIFLLCFLLPACGSARWISRRLPRAAIHALSSATFMLAAAWIGFTAWALALGASGGRIDLLLSPEGFGAVLITATVSVWATTLSSFVMMVPARTPRLITLVAMGILGVGVLATSIAVAVS